MKQLRALLLILFAASLSFAASPKLSRDLKRLRAERPAEETNVIVRFKRNPREKQLNKVRRQGGTLKKRLGLVRSATFTVTADKLEALAADPDIAYISPDRPVFATLDYATPTVGADLATAFGYDGEGVGVAVIDSGVNDHWDLRLRVVHSESFLSKGGKPGDDFGHGSHVGGIIAGNGHESDGLFRGVATKAHLVDLRVLNQEGVGTESAVIAAIQRAIELKDQYNIRILNLSLGRPVFESYDQDPLCQAVEAAWRAGIVVVVAAGNQGRENSYGNDGYGTVASPGNHPLVITVGAMKTRSTMARADDEVASYSSKGPTSVDHVVKPDIVAPGNRIVSLGWKQTYVYQEYPQNLVPLSYYEPTGQGSDSSVEYFRLSGTSMATPMVSGAAALLLQKEPHLTPDQVKARLMKTASKTFPTSSVAFDEVTGESFVSQYDIFTIGAGYLDVQSRPLLRRGLGCRFQRRVAVRRV